MTNSLFISLCTFSIVTSATPGPNNIMLLASGVNFGFRRTIPHTLGISLGFFVLLVAVGAGFGALVSAYPAVPRGLAIVGAAYLIYLAYGVATSAAIDDGRESTKRPITLFDAALFQWVNPKAWMMALTGMAFYADATRPFASTASF